MVWFLLMETKTVPIGRARRELEPIAVEAMSRARRELDAKAGLEGADYQRYRLEC